MMNIFESAYTLKVHFNARMYIFEYVLQVTLTQKMKKLQEKK